ncbi:hypothetical protein Hypma_002698 [Hypsizygus marmoreus]|uniref:Uncharacterized protein n=1 Tax=Hypsizygus marmoreus TaxID=39966 RepID=A0A369J889_HYPMA|nr:hypothetical protein Hypma_002698 [Hypsizygus marmoreus]
MIESEPSTTLSAAASSLQLALAHYSHSKAKSPRFESTAICAKLILVIISIGTKGIDSGWGQGPTTTSSRMGPDAWRSRSTTLPHLFAPCQQWDTIVLLSGPDLKPVVGVGEVGAQRVRLCFVSVLFSPSARSVDLLPSSHPLFSRPAHSV